MKYQLCLKPGASYAIVCVCRWRAVLRDQSYKSSPCQCRRSREDSGSVGSHLSSVISHASSSSWANVMRSDPLCVSVVLTCANFMSAEMHLPKTRQDLSRWQALGDYETKLLEVYKNFIDVWGTAFPKQELSSARYRRFWICRRLSANASSILDLAGSRNVLAFRSCQLDADARKIPAE